ncbi:hypothetical protein FRC05_010629 [Tulasnella sp. 425]|nr:hypothetical protein FRC05_010629 [Tulasnella sp. 425]
MNSLEKLSRQYRLDLDALKFLQGCSVSGASATVFEGRLKKATDSIAIKKFKTGDNISENKVLRALAREVKTLAKLSHPNVVRLLGFAESIKENIACLIFPWAHNGNIHVFLKSGHWEIPERIALHNILVNKRYKAIITDFGSACPITERRPETSKRERSFTEKNTTGTEGDLNRRIESLVSFVQSLSSQTSSGPAWTLRWASPEVLDNEQPGLASDIWALGWVFWEIITGHLPFHELPNEGQVIIRIINKELPPIDSNNLKQLAKVPKLCTLIPRCLNRAPEGRPTSEKCLDVVMQLPSSCPSKDKANNAALSNALGSISCEIGEYDKALWQYDESLALAKSGQDDNLTARVIANIGDVHYRKEQWEDAALQYEDAIDITRSMGWLDFCSDLLYRLSDTLYMMDDREEEARTVFNEARQMAREINNLNGRIEALNKLAHVYYLRGDHSKAISTYKVVQAQCSSHGDYPIPIDTLHGLAILYCLEKRDADAVRIFDKLQDPHRLPPDGLSAVLKALRRVALRLKGDSQVTELFEHGSDDSLEMDAIMQWTEALQGLGYFYFREQRYTESLAVWAEEEENRRIDGDINQLANTLRRIGLVYSKLEQYEEAELAYEEERDIRVNEGHRPDGVVAVLHDLAMAHWKQNKHHAAIYAYEEARKICVNQGMETGHADTLNYLGELYHLEARYSNAAKAFARARNISIDEGYLVGRARATKGLGITLADGEKEYEEAANLLKRAASLYRRIGDHESASECDSVFQQIGGGDGP